jgi:hypothetical protein
VITSLVSTTSLFNVAFLAKMGNCPKEMEIIKRGQNDLPPKQKKGIKYIPIEFWHNMDFRNPF